LGFFDPGIDKRKTEMDTKRGECEDVFCTRNFSGAACGTVGNNKTRNCDGVAKEKKKMMSGSKATRAVRGAIKWKCE
jgi:hypothetical protein